MSSIARLHRIHVRNQDDGAVVIDLTRVDWLDPLHLVHIAATAHAAARAGRRFEVVGLGPEQAAYGARMHLGSVLDELGLANDFAPRGLEQDRRDSLHELRAVRSEDDVRQAADLVALRVSDSDLDAARALHTGIAEIGENAFSHSQVALGFVAVQTIETRASLRFAVADSGVGLLGTLGRRGATTSAAAISLALLGVSESEQPGTGTGVRRTAEALIGVSGEALLLSGDASARITVSGRANRPTPLFAGTLFEGSIPLAKGRHAR